MSHQLKEVCFPKILYSFFINILISLDRIKRGIQLLILRIKMINKKGEIKLKFLGIVLGFIVAVIGLNLGLFFIGVSLIDFSSQDYRGFFLNEKGNLFSEFWSLFSKKFSVGVNVGDSGGGGGGNGGGNGGGDGGSSPSEDCKGNWKCGEWSKCINGEQTRTCMDLNNCRTFKYKPIEKIECEFPFSSATCDDGIKNQEEEDVDCGGPCEPCFEKPLNFEYIKYAGYGVIAGGITLLLIIYLKRRKKKEVLKKYKKKWENVVKRRFG